MSELDIRTLNEFVENDPLGAVAKAESAFKGEIMRCARNAVERKAKIILLAGPSSSGKTTSANILKDVFESLSHKTSVVSLDNFYRERNDPKYPTDENGEQDYESVEALRTDEIKDCLAALLGGKGAFIPKYDFMEGKAIYSDVPVLLGDGEIIILEGLHALNPIIREGLDESEVITLFISVSTNINDGDCGKRILSGRKTRFIRRMTRDSIYRGTNAAATLKRWGSVLLGEDKYLYPYKDSADIKINTFHSFELGVMKPFAEKALAASAGELHGEYIETVMHALGLITPISADIVPDDSLIREFIPGGKYEHLY